MSFESLSLELNESRVGSPKVVFGFLCILGFGDFWVALILGWVFVFFGDSQKPNVYPEKMEPQGLIVASLDS